MDIRERLLPLVGAGNFRDLGGYPTTDGGMTRWGQLFRSDTLHELTEADLEVLREVGLASVIDLRTATELGRSGRGLLGEEMVAYLHASVLQEEGGESVAIPAPSDDDPAERYLWYLEVGRRRAARRARHGGRSEEPSAGLSLRRRQGSDGGPGRTDTGHTGRGTLSDRRRLRHYGDSYGTDLGPLAARSGLGKIRGGDPTWTCACRGDDHGPIPRPALRASWGGTRMGTDSRGPRGGPP